MDASVNRIPSSADERALLIALKTGNQGREEVAESLLELNLLVKTAGGIVIGSLTFNRHSIDPSTIVGKGQLDRVRDYITEEKIKLVVFDINAVKPGQVKTLEEALKCRILGRTEIILDIFARRAKSAESKIQVELAQLRYTLPRLKGLGGVLSRLGGGIGTRGPGETMIETDRRHILRRITVLKKKLEKISKHRQLVRKSRAGEVLGAVVGYTNAGKSTIINILARDDLFVEDRLFATLDSYTRSVYLEEGKKVLLTDTVGFIRNLPANLVESFKSTLEEIREADFLVHVIDGSSGDIEGVISTVNNELVALNSLEKPSILFINKMDRLDNDRQVRSLMLRNSGSLCGSALTGEGLDELRLEITRIRDKIAPPERDKAEDNNFQHIVSEEL